MSSQQMWYVLNPGSAIAGPYSEDEVVSFIQSGNLRHDALGRFGQMGNWVALSESPKFMAAYRRTTVGVQTNQVNTLNRLPAATPPNPNERQASEHEHINRGLWVLIAAGAVVCVSALVAAAVFQNRKEFEKEAALAAAASAQSAIPADCNGSTKERTVHWCRQEAFNQLKLQNSNTFEFVVKNYRCKDTAYGGAKPIFSGYILGTLKTQGYNEPIKKSFWCTYDHPTTDGVLKMESVTTTENDECQGSGREATLKWCKEQAIAELKQPLSSMLFYSDKYACERLHSHPKAPLKKEWQTYRWGEWKGFLKLTVNNQVTWKSFYCINNGPFGSHISIDEDKSKK